MTLRVLAAASSMLVFSCSSPATSPAFDAGAPEPSPVVDGGRDSAPSVDAGREDADVLFAACIPGGEACPSGLSCFVEHTDPAWGCEGLTGCIPDLSGHCYTSCTAETLSACADLGGVCACPVLADGGDVACNAEHHPPGPMVCVPIFSH